MNIVYSAPLLRPNADFHEKEVQSVLRVFSSIKQRVCSRLHAFQERVLHWIKPPTTSLVLGTLADLTRGKAELLAENALLRQQLIILHRQIKRLNIRANYQFWKAVLFAIAGIADPPLLPYAGASLMGAYLSTTL